MPQLWGHVAPLPFLAVNLDTAIHWAYIVVVVELPGIALIRYKFMKTTVISTIVQVIIGGGILFGIGILLGKMGAGN